MSSHGAPARSKPAILSAPWIIGLAGVGALAALLVLAIGLVGDSGRHPRQIPAPVDVAGLPESAGPGSSRSPRPSAGPRQSPGATPSRTQLPSRPPSVAASRPATSMPGRYRVRDTYRNSFVGEVTITNTSREAGNWVVRLVFSTEVTGLRGSGVDPGKDPAVSGSGNTWTFTSTQPLAAGQSAVLWAQFARGDGKQDQPTVCTVNGTACG